MTTSTLTTAFTAPAAAPHPWTTADIPSQAGRLAIVTGTGGLGYDTAAALAQAGAEVILAGRSEAKGLASVLKIRAIYPDAKITFEQVDLASLASIREFSQRMADTHPSIDLLINNAGVMALPKRMTTAEGFEMQFGTNHLGHFALTAGLLPLLRNGQHPRVINVSSLAHRGGKIHFDDLNWQGRYKAWPAYEQSKLANLLFTFELQRRSDANGWGLFVAAAHPGIARTDLIPNGPGPKSLMAIATRYLFHWWGSHSSASGSLPTLYAATSPNVQPAGHYGPNGFYEMKGSPAPAYVAKQARDIAAAKRLWEASGNATGAEWPA